MYLDREEVLYRISHGEILIVLNGKIMKLDNWLKKHPGGAQVILHMVGKDATDEINAYHSDHALKMMQAFMIGQIKLPWQNLPSPIQTTGYRENALHLQSTSPIDNEFQTKISVHYRSLDTELHKEGYYNCDFSNYVYDIARYILLAACFYSSFMYEAYMLSAAFLGLLWHQLVFTAHDAGHMGITHDVTVDTIIGIFVANFIGGLSIGWWKHNHNVHHIVTNHPEHDPDIQHMPFLAVSVRFLESLRSTYYNKVMEFDAFAKAMVQLQPYTYYLVLCFGRFNLYRLSYAFLIFNKGCRHGKSVWFRRLEILGIVAFWYWYGWYVLGTVPSWYQRAGFVFISHTMTMLLHLQITLSHFAMSTEDLGDTESFAQKMIRTTMDIYCPSWLDFIHGGLQFQVAHHLFPRLPRHNLRAVQPLIIEFCRKHNLKYTVYGFGEGNKHVISKLDEIAKQAKISKIRVGSKP